MRIVRTPILVTLLALVTLAWQPDHTGRADERQAPRETRGLAEGNRVPVSLARFYLHPGLWNDSPISNGCPSRMYRETTAIAVHARAPREKLFQILEAVDPISTAVDPWPANQEDKGIRTYALIFHPSNLSDRSDDDRTNLEVQIHALVEEHDIPHTAIAVSRSSESNDADHFGFHPDDDVVIVLSESGLVRSTYRLNWADVTEERIADIVSELQQTLVNGEQ